MSKDDDLIAKAAALAPKPKRKKKAAQSCHLAVSFPT